MKNKQMEKPESLPPPEENLDTTLGAQKIKLMLELDAVDTEIEEAQTGIEIMGRKDVARDGDEIARIKGKLDRENKKLILLLREKTKLEDDIARL